ncbi:MAG: DNA helicase UvrD [Candidatus Micrarchaeota archaeon]|nr:DNA helicase UvrD [Candidatus Micrarchaeota archaeon]
MHSKYAGACSEHLNLESIGGTAAEKGIRIVGTGDFTHPLWFSEIKEKLTEAEEGSGLFKLGNSPTRFMLSSEVCTIFEHKAAARKIHHVILAPGIEVVEQINASLSKYGSLQSDGRPILNKMTPAHLVEIVMGISKDAFVFPAHTWTPWYGALGAFSGFNSIKDAYEDQARHIHALETGLSSDPPMNWRISELDKYTLISGSDAHSLPKMGREAIIVDMDERPSYGKVISSIKEKKLKMTIEFYPEEGKYHFDGHRNCNVSLSPDAARKYNGRCPVCGKSLTIGVLHRIEELADREEGFVPKGSIPYVHAIPLQEVIAYVTGKGEGTAYVHDTYGKLMAEFGSEFNVLLKSDPESIGNVDKELGRAISNVREEKVSITPGYDGVFGIIDIFNRVKKEKKQGRQSVMKDFPSGASQ